MIKYPKLFEDCFFYLHGKFNVFEKADMIKLIELAGGVVLKREPKLDRVNELIPEEPPYHLDREAHPDFECCNFILFDVDKLPTVDHKYLKTVKVSWLFASIDEFKILYPS